MSVQINFTKVLENINHTATNRKAMTELNPDRYQHLTDEMIDVINFIQDKEAEFSHKAPSFGNRHSIFFKCDEQLYQIIFSTDRKFVSIIKMQFGLMQSEEKEYLYASNEVVDTIDYTFDEFLKDNTVYFYYNINKNRVESLWDGKPYVIMEDK